MEEDKFRFGTKMLIHFINKEINIFYPSTNRTTEVNKNEILFFLIQLTNETRLTIKWKKYHDGIL